MCGANSRAQKSRTVSTSCSWSEVSPSSSTFKGYLVGLGVGQATGLGVVRGVGVTRGDAVGLGEVFGVAVARGVGDGQVTGAGEGTGCRSSGPTRPMNGRRLPKPRMNGTI